MRRAAGPRREVLTGAEFNVTGKPFSLTATSLSMDGAVGGGRACAQAGHLKRRT
jgi:hypothetical protein